MTHDAETGAIDRLHLPAPVSGTCVMQIWHRIRMEYRNWYQRRLEHCSIPSQKVACTWLKWWRMIGR